MLIHLVDTAGVDGRDPVEDIIHINEELARYSADLAALPQVIGANKSDLPDSEIFMDEVRAYCEENNIPMFPISAATGAGVRALLDHVVALRDSMQESSPVVFEKEYFVEEHSTREFEDDAIGIEIDADGDYLIYGDPIDKMLGYTNLESEKGFDFFQKFLKERGVIDRLKEMGIEEGDTVVVGDIQFEYLI